MTDAAAPATLPTPQLLVRVVDLMNICRRRRFGANFCEALGGTFDDAHSISPACDDERVYDAGFELSTRSGPIQVVINPDGQTVAGTVATATGTPVSGATVVLVPPEAQQENVARFKNATTDEQGRFTIHGVAPGAYTAYAWESISLYSWLSPKRIERSAGRGRPLTISSGGSSDLQLQAIPAGN